MKLKKRNPSGGGTAGRMMIYMMILLIAAVIAMGITYGRVALQEALFCLGIRRGRGLRAAPAEAHPAGQTRDMKHVPPASSASQTHPAASPRSRVRETCRVETSALSGRSSRHRPHSHGSCSVS